jgi:hypothetical protein
LYLRPLLHPANVIVQWLDPDLGLAHCSDERGKRYTIDHRSAVSISALREGLPLTVMATAGGVVKFLVLDDSDLPVGWNVGTSSENRSQNYMKDST